MFSFLFRAAFWLALVYFLVPLDAIFGEGTSRLLPSFSSAPTVSDIRTVTTSTIYVRPDGRIVNAASPSARPEETAAAPAAATSRPSAAEVMSFCDRNQKVCAVGFGILYGAADKAGDALSALGELVKPDPAPRHTASSDTLTDSDRLIAPGGRAIP
ncbi:hypothetical protein ACRC7T_00430 [Segnochrobactraceae bacterium EtOH-i3]